MKQTMHRSIVELISSPREQHDLQWLQESLQAAVELELSTIPPYLCALWSIKDTSSDAYQLVQSVVLEEMLHMGLACNMLTAIGCVPVLNNNIPAYPGHLPGGVRPGLTVYLAGLSKNYLEKVLMQIEFPERGPTALTADGKIYPTIGAFYDAISSAFRTLQPSLTRTNQLDGATLNTYPIYLITTLDDALKAISEIKEQGEGTWNSPEAIGFGGELAHYYKFGQIFYGKYLEQQCNGTWEYTGGVVPFPSVFPMSPIPTGGYVNPPKTVVDQLAEFNKLFAAMLDKLQSAWANGSEDDLNSAIGIMFLLKPKAIALMEIPLPDGNGVYGPDFLIS
jgi:hypothetical protein